MCLERARDLPPPRAAFQPLGAGGCWTDSLKDSFTSAYSAAARFPPSVGRRGWVIVSGEAGGLPLPPVFVYTSFIWAGRPFPLAAVRAGWIQPSARDARAVILGTIVF